MFVAFAYALSFDNEPTTEEEQERKEAELKMDNNEGSSDGNTKKPFEINKNTPAPLPGAAAAARASNSNAAAATNIDREHFRYNMVHAMSLMHALCLQHLRCDWDLNNLSKHNEDFLPAWDSASTAGFTIHFWNYFLPRNRVNSRASFYKASKIQVIGGVTQHERRVLGTTPVRTTTMTRRGSVEAERYSQFERSSKTFKAAKNWSISSFWTSDTACYMRGATERPYKLIFSTLELIRHRFEKGGLNMPAPILASIWQAMDHSIQAFEQCRYLSDTPFPFPWAQLIIVVLVVWQAIIPLTVIVSYDDKALGVTIAVASTWILWALNEVARDIEDPFTQEPNDLPLARLQYQFNERLLAVAASHGEEDLGWTYKDFSREMHTGDDVVANDMNSGYVEEEKRELPEYKGGLEATASQGLAEGV